MRLLIRAEPTRAAAITAIAELLGELQLQNAFVGNVARSAWLGTNVVNGPIDVLAMLSPERMRQVPTMASHRGFRVDPREVERAEELDLIPLSFGEARIHVLMATNALYGKMIAKGVEARLDDLAVRVVTAEDLALLLLMADDPTTVETLIATTADFDLEMLNRKLVSIGLARKSIAR